MNFKEFLKFAAIPIVFLSAALLGLLLWDVFGLPDKEEIISSIQQYFAKYGYWVVFVGAFAEGLLFLNWYLPGSIVAVMGVVFAKQNDLNVVWVVGLITLAFFLTCLINYALGRYGWDHIFMKFGLKAPLERIRLRVENKGLPIIFSTYIHPNIGALTATSAGILKLKFREFFLFSLTAVIFWNTLWGVVVYFSGPYILKFLGFGMASLYALGWIIFSGYRFWKKRAILPPSVP